jgi:hypothetical protein
VLAHEQPSASPSGAESPVTIGSTKSGYSNHKEHLAMFKAGIAELKAKEPWRFPFALYLDNWCVFPLCRGG